MMPPLDLIPSGSTYVVPFHTFSSAGASVTITGLAVTDIEIYKGASMTQRSSDAGYALMDTDGIDLDGITGIHGFSIDLADNTDAGFFAVGSTYFVVVSAITVNAQTVNMVVARFRIMAAEGVTGKPKVDVDAFGGTAGTFAAGIPETKVASIAANALTAAAINADAFTAAKFAADVTTELQSGLATAANLAAVFAAVDTEVAAIKVNTDKMVFTVANQLDVNVKSNAGTAITSAAGIQEVKVASIAANALTAAAINADAFTAAKFAADVTTELQSGLATAANLAAVFAAVDTEVAAILAAVDTEIAALPTAIQIADALLDRSAGIETGLTPRQALRLIAAAAAGKLSGAATATNTIRNAVADSKNRIVATADAAGNRTAITYDLT